jgi:hypothetical protein
MTSCDTQFSLKVSERLRSPSGHRARGGSDSEHERAEAMKRYQCRITEKYCEHSRVIAIIIGYLKEFDKF